jgi:hypothetical protein
MLVPFIDTVLDVPTGNASRGILSIGKDYLSLWIPFTLLVSNRCSVRSSSAIDRLLDRLVRVLVDPEYQKRNAW